MSDNTSIGSIFLDVILNTDGIESQISQINTTKIKPSVDLEPLHQLNQLLDVKKRHLGETVSYFNNNPIRPRVDNAGLISLRRELSETRTAANFSASIETAVALREIVRLREQIQQEFREMGASLPRAISNEMPSLLREMREVKRVTRVAPIRIKFDVDKIDNFFDPKRIVNSLATAIATTAFAPVTIPFKLIKSAAGNLFEGAFKGIGEELSRDFGRGFSISTSDFIRRQTGMSTAEMGAVSGKYVTTRGKIGAEYLAQEAGYANGLKGVEQDLSAIGASIDKVLRNPRKAVRNLENKVVQYLEYGYEGNDQGQKEIIDESLEGLYSSGRRAAGVGLRLAAQPIRIRNKAKLKGNAAKAAELAKSIEIDDYDAEAAGKADAIHIVTGGLDFGDGENAHFAAQLLKQKFLKAYTVKHVNSEMNQRINASDGGVMGMVKSLQEMLGKEGAESSDTPIMKLAQMAIDMGHNPDGLQMFAKAMKMRQLHPDKPINFMGTSGGVDAVNYAVALAEKAGMKDVKGVGFGLPMANLTELASKKNFQSIIGTLDHLDLIMHGGANIGGETAANKAIVAEIKKSLPMNADGVFSVGKTQKNVLGAGLGHAIGNTYLGNEEVMQSAVDFITRKGQPVPILRDDIKDAATLNAFYANKFNAKRKEVPLTLAALYRDSKALARIEADPEGKTGDYTYFSPANKNHEGDWLRISEFQDFKKDVRGESIEGSSDQENEARKKKGLLKIIKARKASAEKKGQRSLFVEHAQEWLDFLDEMETGMTQFRDTGEMPYNALQKGAEFYPELRKMAAREAHKKSVKGSQRKAVDRIYQTGNLSEINRLREFHDLPNVGSTFGYRDALGVPDWAVAQAENSVIKEAPTTRRALPSVWNLDLSNDKTRNRRRGAKLDIPKSASTQENESHDSSGDQYSTKAVSNSTTTTTTKLSNIVQGFETSVIRFDNAVTRFDAAISAIGTNPPGSRAPIKLDPKSPVDNKESNQIMELATVAAGATVKGGSKAAGAVGNWIKDPVDNALNTTAYQVGNAYRAVTAAKDMITDVIPYAKPIEKTITGVVLPAMVANAAVHNPVIGGAAQAGLDLIGGGMGMAGNAAVDLFTGLMPWALKSGVSSIGHSVVGAGAAGASSLLGGKMALNTAGAVLGKMFPGFNENPNQIADKKRQALQAEQHQELVNAVIRQAEILDNFKTVMSDDRTSSQSVDKLPTVSQEEDFKNQKIIDNYETASEKREREFIEKYNDLKKPIIKEPGTQKIENSIEKLDVLQSKDIAKEISRIKSVLQKNRVDTINKLRSKDPAVIAQGLLDAESYGYGLDILAKDLEGLKSKIAPAKLANPSKAKELETSRKTIDGMLSSRGAQTKSMSDTIDLVKNDQKLRAASAEFLPDTKKKSIFDNIKKSLLGNQKEGGFSNAEAVLTSLIAGLGIAVAPGIGIPLAVGGGLIAALKKSKFGQSEFANQPIKLLGSINKPILANEPVSSSGSMNLLNLRNSSLPGDPKPSGFEKITAKAFESIDLPSGPLKGFLSNIGSVAVKLAALGAGVATLTFAFGNAAVLFNKAAQNMSATAAIRDSLSNPSDAPSFIKRLDAGADLTGSSRLENKLNSRGFISASKGTALEGESSLNVLSGIAAYGAQLGSSPDEKKRALLAIGQSVGKGTLQSEEVFGQLAEAMPGIVKELAAANGLTIGQLRAEMKAGNAQSVPMIARFGSRLDTLVDVNRRKIESQPGVMAASVPSAVQNLMTSGGEIILPLAAPLKVVGGLINYIADNLKGITDGLTKAIGLIVIKVASSLGVFEAIAKALSFASIKTAVSNVTDLIKKNADELKNLGKSASKAVGEMALFALAIESITTAWSIFNGGNSPIKEFTKDLQDAKNALKTGKKDSPVSGDVGTRLNEVYGKDSNFIEKIVDNIGKIAQEGSFLKPGEIRKGATATANRKFEEELTSGQELINQVDSNIVAVKGAMKGQSVTDAQKQSLDLDRRIKNNRLEQLNPKLISENGGKGLEEKQQELVALIAEKQKLESTPGKLIITVDKSLDAINSTIERLRQLPDTPETKAQLEQLIEKTKAFELEKVKIQELQKTIMARDKANEERVRAINFASELGKQTLERVSTSAQSELISDTSGTLATGDRESRQYSLTLAKAQAASLIARTAESAHGGVINDNYGDDIKRLREAKLIRTADLQDLTEMELKALEGNKEVDQTLLTSLKSFVGSGKERRAAEQEEITLRDARRRALNEEFKASKEYYENTVMSSQEMRTTLSTQASELKKQTYTTKLKSGLVGFSSAMSQYTTGMIDIITELGKITTAEYEKTKKEQELAKQRLEAERANTAKDNAASVATKDIQYPSDITNSSSDDKLIAPIKGQTVETFANYKPKSPEGFYDKRKRKTGIHNHEGTDFTDRAGSGEDAEVVAMMGGKATRLAAGPAWMGDMVKITNGNKVLNQIHMKPGSMNPRLKMGETIDINQGEYLGRVANLSGKAENHVHVDLSIDGKKVVVEDYLKKQLTSSTSPSSPSTSSPSTSSIKNKVIVSRTGEQDNKGLEKLKVETYNAQGKIISSLIANSGDPTKQRFSDSGQSVSETREPFEYGSYSIGKATKGFDPSKVGKTFLPINPKFNTKRTNLGIHVDADRAIQAGSAGCLVFGTPAQLAEFQKSIANGQVDELQFVKSIKTLAGSSAKTNTKSKPDTNTESTSGYTTVKATAYFPGKGDPRMEGGEVDIRDKKITENSLVMATRTTDTKGGIPYGTKAEIRNPKTGKTAIVSVVDRGPLAPGRDIDLTGGAFRAIDMTPDGINDVQMRIIGKEGSFDLGMSTKGDRDFYKRVGNGGKIVNGSRPNANTKFTNASTKIASTDNAENNALTAASAENNARAYKSQMDSFDEQQKAIEKTYTSSIKLTEIAAITKTNEVKRNLTKANRAKAEQELKTKRESEDKNRTIGYQNTPEDARRYALIDSARKNDDEAMQYKNRIEDGKLELAENEKIVKQLEANMKNPLKLTTEERKIVSKMLKTLPGLVKAQKKNIKQANDRLYEINKQTAKNTADINMKFDYEQKDIYSASGREVNQSQIEFKRTELENIKSFQKTNPFDNSQGDPIAVEREMGLMINKNKYDNAKQQIEKQMREGSKDPKIQADLKSRLAILVATLQQENAATNIKFAEQTQEIDAAKAKYLFDRISLVTQTTRALNSSQGALRSAMGNTYQAKLYSIQDEKANLGDSLQTELFGISEERKKATTKKQMEELNIREANIRATNANKISTIDTLFNRENDDKMFSYDRQIDSSNLDLMSTKSTNLSKRGNSYDASAQEHEIAKSRLELEYTNKMKEFDNQLLAADGDNYTTDRINKLRDSFMLLNDVKLDAIEEEFSRFKGVMDETVKASDNIIGKMVGGMGTSEDDWLALLRAPFKGITDEITKFLSSTMNEAIHDGLSGMKGYLNKALGGESSGSVSARAKDNNSGFGGLLSTVGRWFGIGGQSPDKLSIGTDFLGSISGLLPFADGGVINPHKAQGAGDTTMIRVNNGEAIMVPEFVKMMGGAHGIDKLNRNARGYADGGVIGSVPSTLGAAIAAPEISRPMIVEYTKIGERDYVDREHLDNMLQNQQKQSESRLREYDRQTQDRMRYSQQYRSSVGLR